MKNLSLKLMLLGAVLFGYTHANAQFPEGFEAGVPPTGWSQFDVVSDSRVWGTSTTTQAGAGAAFVRYSDGVGASEDYLVSPQFTPTAGQDLIFWERESFSTDYGSTYSVRVSTAGNTLASDFTTVLWSRTETPVVLTYTERTVSLAAYVGTPIYIAFVNENDDGDSWFVDEVDVAAPPTCLDPTGLAASSITASGLNADWTSPNTGAGETYNLYVVLDGGTPATADATGSAAMGANSVALTTYGGSTPLDPNTDYDLYVEEDCSAAAGGTSTLIGPVSFTTLCATEVPDYTEDFDSFVPTCWDEATASVTPGDPTTGPTGFGSGDWGGRTTYDPSGSAAVNLFNLGTDDWIVSPTFDLSAGGYEVKTEVALTNFFSAAADADGFTGTDDEVQLLYTEDGVTWINIATWNAANEPDETGLVETFTLATTGSSVQFGFWASEGAIDDGPDYDFHVSEFTVQTPPACPDVTALAVTNFSLTNVDISWAAASGATNYLWEIQDSPNAQGTPGAIASGSGAATMAAAAGAYVDGNDYILYVVSECPTQGTYQSLPFTLLVPPANDDCGGAIALTLGAGSCGTPTPGTNLGATDSGIAHTCASYGGGDIWYSVMVPASGNVTVQSFDTGSSWSDGGMAIYEGTCPGALVEVDCDDDGGTSAFEMISLTGRTPGETLYIAVWEFGNNAFGDMEICAWEPPAPPANDECSAAEVLTVNADLACGVFASGTLDQATASAETEGCSGTFDNDVWYVFEATGTEHQLSVFNTAGSSTDMVYQVTEGSCGGTEIFCHDTPNAGFLMTGLTPGTDYYVRVDTWTSTPSNTSFDICIGTPPPPPANDDCAGAIDITPSDWGTPGWMSFSNASATESMSACAGFGADDDIWFSFVAQSANDAVLARGTGVDPVIEIFDACGGTSLGCTDNNGTGSTERALPGSLVAGNTYYYRVWHYSSGGGGGTIETQVKTFHDGMVNGNFCGNLDHTLDESIYAERDDLGELYANPSVPVKGYEFRFQEVGGGLDVTAAHPDELAYITLADVGGLEYGKTYDVSVRHRIRTSANGFVDEYWSDYGTSCVIGLGAAPTTNLNATSCSALDLDLSDQLLAEPLAGATEYRFNFSGGGDNFTKFTPNYSVLLYSVGSATGGLQYNTAYTVTVQAFVSGAWTAVGAPCSIGMASGPGDVAVQASYCEGATYFYPDPNFILATQVYGAEEYTWRFTPALGGPSQEQVTAGLSLAFHTASDLSLVGGQYNVEVKVKAGGVYGDYTDVCLITIDDGSMPGTIEGQGGNSTASVKSIADGAQASLFPNPNDGSEMMINMEGLSGDELLAAVTVTEITGRVVFADSYPVKGETAMIRVQPDGGLTAGIYLVNVEVGAQTMTQRLVVK